MTGFGKVTAELPGKKVTVEIKSLNSKQLDLSVRVPAAYRDREMALRNELLQRLERGKVDLNINVEYIGRDTSARINATAVTGYCEQIRELAGRLGIPEPTDWFGILLRHQRGHQPAQRLPHAGGRHAAPRLRAEDRRHQRPAP